MDGIDKLRQLIEEAYNNNAYAEYKTVWIEINGGVPIYYQKNKECTATDAINYLDDLLN